jgi:nicotinate-nucleotide pyrophosphorylase (carboxylating)
LSDDLASDEGSGDIVESMTYSKAGGVVCGKVPIDVLIEDFFPSCNINWFVEDGERISIGDKILSLSGPSASVLSCERVLLNILGRLSGIATLTSEWVREADGIGVACTRKTSWGLLDKWAVHIGGGLTHRLSRSDALMIKENDLGVISPESEPENSIPTAISSINLEANAKFTVIEVQDASQAILAARAWSQSQKTRNGSEPIVILLDNMGPSACGSTGESLKSLGLREWCILEGSGGVKREDLPSWKAVSGVDVVSSSEVNMNSGTFDFSMLIGGV